MTLPAPSAQKLAELQSLDPSGLLMHAATLYPEIKAKVWQFGAVIHLIDVTDAWREKFNPETERNCQSMTEWWAVQFREGSSTATKWRNGAKAYFSPDLTDEQREQLQHLSPPQLYETGLVKLLTSRNEADREKAIEIASAGKTSEEIKRAVRADPDQHNDVSGLKRLSKLVTGNVFAKWREAEAVLTRYAEKELNDSELVMAAALTILAAPELGGGE